MNNLLGVIFLTTIFGLFSALGITWYARAARLLGPRDVARSASFGISDTILAGLLSLLFLATIAESTGEEPIITSGAVVMSMIVMGGLVSLIVCSLLIRRLNVVELFGLYWPGWRYQLRWLGISFLAMFPVVIGAHLLSSSFFPPDKQVQGIVLFFQQSNSWADRLLVIVMAVVAAPVTEEFIFRGYLYGVFRKYVGRLFGMLVVSALFAAFHVHLPALAGLFLLAMALNFVYERTGSLWAPILMHAAFNATSLVFALIWPDGAP